MKKMTRVTLLAAGMLTSAMAMAGGASTPGWYVGAGYADTEIEFDNVNSDADVAVLFARAGYQLNQNVAIEGRLGLATDDDTINGVNIDIKDMYGIYLKAGMPTQVGLYPYVLLGMTHAKVEARGRFVSASDSGSDISYGFGADYWFTSQVSAGLEFTQYYDKDDAEVSGLTLGLNFKF